MRQKTVRETMPDELVLATGLIWGHLNARQFEDAYRLAKGCLRLWPDDKGLTMMAAYAAAEVLEPVDKKRLGKLRDTTSEDWITLVLRRAEAHGGDGVPETPVRTLPPGKKIAA
jgi:hypothetical protein